MVALVCLLEAPLLTHSVVPQISPEHLSRRPTPPALPHSSGPQGGRAAFPHVPLCSCGWCPFLSRLPEGLCCSRGRLSSVLQSWHPGQTSEMCQRGEGPVGHRSISHSTTPPLSRYTARHPPASKAEGRALMEQWPNGFPACS